MSRKTVAMSLAAAFISAPAAGLVPPESLTCQLFPLADINADKGPWNKGDPTAVATLILGKKHWELKGRLGTSTGDVVISVWYDKNSLQYALYRAVGSNTSYLLDVSYVDGKGLLKSKDRDEQMKPIYWAECFPPK
jgi:hypothetical protein